MNLDFLREASADAGAADAIIWRDDAYSYDWLWSAVDRAREDLTKTGIEPGQVVSLEADFSPAAVAMLMALMENDCIIVPLTESVEHKKPTFRDVAEVQWILTIDGDDEWQAQPTGVEVSHELLLALGERGSPGLVLFSSGSTGDSKAALHDLAPMMDKFRVRRHTRRAITFLLFDHIGGFNTLMYNLSNGGCTVTVQERSPEAVCSAIERHKVALLPTSPTFINLLLVSGAYEQHDLSTLEVVTYGTEVMPESTLKRFHELFPDITLQQTYGLSEVGILRSKSRANDSVWVRLGGEGFETRVVDGKLEIKAQSAMLGYLNAPSPFTDDGWFITGDVVEVDGDFFRVLGRESEIINVGGEKVYPAEIEGVLEGMDGVEEAIVRSEPHPITGQIVSAVVRLSTDETLKEFRSRMRGYCRDRMERFKIPQKVQLVEDELHGERFKKMRKL